MTEFDLKAGRLAAVARAAGLGGVLVGTPPNFSWLTGGRTNRIDMTREAGAGALFVTTEAEVCVLANAIEMPRLLDEALAGLTVTPVEIPWADERARPGWAVDAGRARTGRPVGADWPAPEAVLVDGAIARARVPLVPAEMARLRAFGAEAGQTLGALCRTLRPGQTEEAVAGAAIAAFAAIGARSHVTLVGADARLPRVPPSGADCPALARSGHGGHVRRASGPRGRPQPVCRCGLAAARVARATLGHRRGLRRPARRDPRRCDRCDDLRRGRDRLRTRRGAR